MSRPTPTPAMRRTSSAESAAKRLRADLAQALAALKRCDTHIRTMDADENYLPSEGLSAELRRLADETAGYAEMMKRKV